MEDQKASFIIRVMEDKHTYNVSRRLTGKVGFQEPRPVKAECIIKAR